MKNTITKTITEPEIYLSVVAAAFNEQDNLVQLIQEICQVLKTINSNWEIIIVDDHSTDKSINLLQKQQKLITKLRVISLKKRSGQTAALDAGIRCSKGRYIATLDADLQNDPADIPKLLNAVCSGKCDMACGWRIKRHDNLIRRISTKTANYVRNLLTHENIHDSGCCLRVFHRDCLKKIQLFNGMHRFLPTLVKMQGYKVTEIPVNHRPRKAGTTKYGISNRAFKALRDTFAVRWMQNRILLYQMQELKNNTLQQQQDMQ